MQVDQEAYYWDLEREEKQGRTRMRRLKSSSPVRLAE
jgi:hypothetical protein